MAVLLIAASPAMLHIGNLGGANLRPARIRSEAERWLFRALPGLLALNGALLASAYLAWRSGSNWWAAIVALACPVIAMQLAALTITNSRYVTDKQVSRRSRRR